MSKLIEKDGKFYRTRRGKIVQIPPEWVGRIKFQRCMTRRDWLRKWNSRLIRKMETLAHKELIEEWYHRPNG